jgi:hypothetical protein
MMMLRTSETVPLLMYAEYRFAVQDKRPYVIRGRERVAYRLGAEQRKGVVSLGGLMVVRAATQHSRRAVELVRHLVGCRSR